MQRQRNGLVDAIRIDVARLHATWMEILFPRQLNPSRVLGKWTPDTTGQQISYYGWGLLGLPLVLLGYPLLLLGYTTRFYAKKLDTATARIGILGVVLTSLVAWGLLTAAAWFRNFSAEGLVAVAAAGGVATIAAVLAVVFSRVGGRFTSVLLAYPAAMTALFLPPVVAALYSPALANVIFPESTSIAIWILDNVLTVGGINDVLREQFALEGAAYVLMWFGIAVPLGWLLGAVVALADVVRPSGDDKRGRRQSSGV